MEHAILALGSHYLNEEHFHDFLAIRTFENERDATHVPF